MALERKKLEVPLNILNFKIFNVNTGNSNKIQ